MDNEKLQQFMTPILLVVFAFLILVYMIMTQIVPNVQNAMAAKTEMENTQSGLTQAQEKLEKLKAEAASEEQKAKKAQSATTAPEKPFFKPVMSGLDTEAVIAGEFTEILELIRANKIKVRSIKYDYDPQDDNFVKGASAQYNVARLNMEMVANYLDYDNFLKELYKHEHFLDVQSVEIVPYRKNKSILLVNFKLKLYAKK